MALTERHIRSPPRLTVFLRNSTKLSSSLKNNCKYDFASVLAIKREEKRKEMLLQKNSWQNVKSAMEGIGMEKKINLGCYLRDIFEVSKLISPDPDVRDEVSLLLLRTCYADEVLPYSQKAKIQNVVGDIKQSLIDRAHKATQNIVDIIGKEEVSNLLRRDEDVPSTIFGSNIKIDHNMPAPMLPSIENLIHLSKLSKKKNENREVSLNFEDYTEKVPHAAVIEKEELFGRSWVEAQMLKYYSDTTMISELVNGTISLLCSSKSNNELENELFDLLGFERFELIQTLLSKREDLKYAAKKKDLAIGKIIENIDKMPSNEGPSYGQKVTVMSETEKQYLKLARKEEKKYLKAVKGVLENDDLNPEDLKFKREAALYEASQLSLLKRSTGLIKQEPNLPYVFDNFMKARQCAGFIAGKKMVLPEGFKRISDDAIEEVQIPESGPAPVDVGSNFIPVSSLDEVGKMAFKGCKSLNRIQTVVFPMAYHSNENLLICAPTGAGKTNIAMLTVIHQIRQHIEEGVIQKDKFKVVYVAPMKALAAEMARNFGKRLEPLGLSVRELTGDMHLTKPEIMQTNMIITTPEKWDVTTRKPGDTQLSQLVKLLIIDEVHLLHGDRGPVLESLIARTLRMVESQQSMIRIVGLSATLPNYIDIASFLRVNPYKGLFFFDGRFRPVPLGLSFIGVKALGRLKQMEEMDRIAFEKCLHFVSHGQQVMVFVHARNGTLRTAQSLIRIAQDRGKTSEFLPENLPDVGRARKDLSKSRNKKLLELFDSGFGVHHAGLLRHDRTLMEHLFQHGFIKVLVTTATLAWGVNLPAHAVIIKGTDIYDSKRGEMVDLGILDVLQIFGRAGRPQYDKSGHGTIITTHDKLNHYLSLLTNQYPIESSFINHLADNLNAEVSLGNVTDVDEAVEWLSYTYLYIRMRKNPQVYGLTYIQAQEDPLLENYRKDLIHVAARSLDKAHMVRFDGSSGYMHITDLGRIASQYYIKYDSVEVFNEFLKQIMNEADILALISNASEFSQLKIRDEEMDELDILHSNCEVLAKGGVENIHGKVNILLQSYISRQHVDGFSLISDMNYITENSVRIARALFEVVLHKGWPLLAGRFLTISKMLEHRMWFFETPLKQFHRLSFEIIEKIEDKRLTIERLRDMDHREIGKMIRHERMGREVKQAAFQFPLLNIESTIQPITRTVLRITLDILPDFTWNDKVHGSHEVYWIWVEDPINNHMYHHEEFKLSKKQVVRQELQQLVFTIPIFEPLPTQYYIRAVSDKWIGCESTYPISFEHLILPERHPPNTALLDLKPLPIAALNNTRYESLYKFSHFNPIQTQIFHCLYHTDENVLLGAPTGSGKTIAAEIAMFRIFKHQADTKVVYIAPLKALVRERVEDWKARLGTLNKSVVELTGDVTPDIQAIQNSNVIITTPEKWDGISRSWQTRSYVRKVSLIVIDEIHLLGEERGPVLEVIVSRTNFISSHTNRKLRIIGLSTALANATDLANWLGIKQMGLYNFRPSVRPVPLEVHISGFPGKHYCPRMATMNKPTFQAIRQHSPEKPVLVFVSSRRQTRLTAMDLMSFVVTEPNPKQWLRLPEHEMEQILCGIKDENLRLCMSFGVGLHHAGLVESDRKVVEELFVNQKIQILITTATLAWGVNFPAHLVVVKGTEYFDGKTKRYVDFPITDVLQMMGRAGRPQFDDHGVAVILVHDQKKHFYKKFLYEPFPVESSLLKVLPDHLNAEIVAGTITTKQEALDYLTWTYLFRRLAQNPTYYNLEISEGNEQMALNKFLSSIVDGALKSLIECSCILIYDDDRTVESTPLGRIASFYYLSHKSIQHFQEKLHKNMNMEDILNILTEAQEYAELPVRHNEDNLNGELAQKCPIEVNTYTFDSSHTKTHLLLQAHMSHIPLPCVDYLTDTKSVLDQAIRVLQAMVDVCSCAGWLAASLQIQLLMQMITQARWHYDPSILTLPYVTHDILSSFRYKNRYLSALPELIEVVGDNYEVLATMLREELDEGQIETVFQTLKGFPAVNLSLTVDGIWRDNERKQMDIPILQRKTEFVSLHANQSYTLTIFLHKTNKDKRTRVQAPKFPKPKFEGWFLTLGERTSGELIALKRVPPIKERATHSIEFTTPPTQGHAVLTLYLMSDSYLGLDQQFDLQFNILEPLPFVENIEDVEEPKISLQTRPEKTTVKEEEKSLINETNFPDLKSSFQTPPNHQKVTKKK